MKLEQAWSHYTDYTKDFTTQSRKVAFALGAGCWFFRTPEATFPYWVLWSLVVLVGFFVFDLAQDLIALCLLRRWLREQEKEIYDRTGNLDHETEVEKPWWLDWPSFLFFLIKTVMLLLAVVCLILHFSDRLQKAS
jgi:hypothetical protein